MTFKPLYIRKYEEGLIQSRPDFILPNDAFPTLFNAYIYREKILKKSGASKLGRLRRVFTDVSIGNSGASVWSFNLFALVTPAITETLKQLEPGSVTITIGTEDFVDNGLGILTNATTGNSGTVNYNTGAITITHTLGAGVASTATFGYFPTLPVMGINTRELLSITQEETIVFDTKYAYVYEAGEYVEFIPGTTWSGGDADFFWSTNYWVQPDGAAKIFWVTNFSGSTGDPIRYTNGSDWVDFAPTINSSGGKLTQCRAILPFRGSLLAFNTWEGADLATSINYPQRIRWCGIGNPISDTSVIFPNAGDVNVNAWIDSPPGKGGYLDIPTSQDIVLVGFVRDNLIIYCERSTWQLRYTGQTIQPFQIEKVNSEIGSASTFSGVPFDTSISAIGQTGISNCDSFKSTRIDIKNPDLAFNINSENSGMQRIYGARDYPKRLAYWIYPDPTGEEEASVDVIYPNRRLVYNYENDSWGIFYDSFTALGTFQPTDNPSWDLDIPWDDINFTWASKPESLPLIIGGNQMGYVMILNDLTLNDPSLTITAITSDGVTPTQLTCPNHNLDPNTLITISGIPIGTPYATSLNNPKQALISNITKATNAVVTSASHTLSTGDSVLFQDVGGMTEINGDESIITVIDSNTFSCDNIDSTTFTTYTSGGFWQLNTPTVFLASINQDDTTKIDLYKFNEESQTFITPQFDASATYIGGGEISVRDNFFIQSKKFHFLDEGEATRLGYMDIVAKTNAQGEMSLYTFANYVDSPTNTLPLNVNVITNMVDPFFNSRVPLQDNGQGEVSFQRVICPTYGSFISFAWTFSPSQMNSNKCETGVEIQSHILWMRKSGKQLNRI